MKHYMVRGSMTIEMTLLMPFILGIFIFIIFSGFILHDKCIVNKACRSAALRGSEESDDDNALDRAYEAIDEVLPDHLIGKWDYSTNIDIGKDAVKVTFKGSAEFGKGLLYKLIGVTDTVHDYECTGYRVNEEEFLRTKKKSGEGYCL